MVRAVIYGCVLIAAAGCTAFPILGTDTTAESGDAGGTVAPGLMPAPIGNDALPTPEAPDTAAPTTTSPVAAEAATIADLATGDRVLVIGDSALIDATTTEDLMCAELSKNGWAAEFAVERFASVGFAAEAYIARTANTDLPPIDAVLLALDNLDEDRAAAYQAELQTFFDAAGDTPVAVFNLAIDPTDENEARANADINDWLTNQIAVADSVKLIDWVAAIDTASDPLVDGVAPTAQGVQTLITLAGETMGNAGGLGQCIPAEL